MTTNELRKVISENSCFDWLKSIKTTLSYSHINFSQEFTGITAMYEFVCKQIDGWKKLDIALPEEFELSLSHFKSLQENLLSLIVQNNISSLQYKWQNEIQQKFNSQTIINKQDKKIFIYNCPETDFLLSIHNSLPKSFLGAYDYISKNQIADYRSIEYLSGMILAYEFQIKDYSSILERRNSEKSSISKIRNDFAKYLSESETFLTDYLSTIDSKFKNQSSALDKTKAEKESLFDEWFSKTQIETTEFDLTTRKKFDDLEELYREKLRMDAPAEFWKKRAVVLKTEARNTLKWLLLLVAVGSLTLYLLLWQTPEGMLLSLFKGDAAAVKWTLIFVTFLSFLAYGIKVLARITFSSFHLARDAEEREQLTHIYLALKKDTTIDQEERKLIMQSIFSRADTGLLKEDSSPTMPGNMMSSIISGHK